MSLVITDVSQWMSFWPGCMPWCQKPGQQPGLRTGDAEPKVKLVQKVDFRTTDQLYIIRTILQQAGPEEGGSGPVSSRMGGK